MDKALPIRFVCPIISKAGIGKIEKSVTNSFASRNIR